MVKHGGLYHLTCYTPNFPRIALGSSLVQSHSSDQSSNVFQRREMFQNQSKYDLDQEHPGLGIPEIPPHWAKIRIK